MMPPFNASPGSAKNSNAKQQETAAHSLFFGCPKRRRARISASNKILLG
jgi:hypothetical protein